ncbi:MAG: SLBB domain-containing protein [Bacteroidia bacterium]|nr:SLBB domain-containing protein [Bacteroidia bacterium]
MNKIFWRIFLTTTTFLICGVVSMAQPTGTGTPAALPLDKLPTFQQRIDQLREAGVTDQQLPGLSGIGLPAIPGSVSPTNSASGFPTPTPAQVDVPDATTDGQAPVLEEDEAEYKDKPKQITSINLSRTPASNVFGHQLFTGSDVSFDLSTGNSVPESYIVGPGDVFTVTVYRRAELFESLPVATDGSVIRQYIGKVYVGGLTFGAAREVLESRYRRIVPEDAVIEIRLTPNQRAINVNIVGEVQRPGAYRIDAAVPAFNALFAAGGITNIGSVRNIQIKRNGVTIQTLDLYDYLIRGTDKPIYLKDNDFIYVPVQGRIAEVVGAVQRPREYELLEGEHLHELLYFSGGLTFDALRKDAQIARLDLESEREVLINFPLETYLDSTNRDYVLMPGDRVIIKKVNKGAYNIVQVYGNVEYPGNYQLVSGERITDIVSKAGGIGIDAYLERIYLVRIVPNTSEVIYIPLDASNIFLEYNDPNNLALQYFDALIIFSESDFRDNRAINVTGQVRKPGIYGTSPTMTLKDLLFLAGGLQEDADFQNIELSIIPRAEALEIAKSRKGNAATEGEATEGDAAAAPAAETEDPYADIEDDLKTVVRISISRDWQNDPTLDTLLVRPYDRVNIYSKYDFLSVRYIEVEGAVNRPGRFQLKRGMTLKDLLYLSGGLSPQADVNEVELYRYIDLELLGNYNTGYKEPEIERIAIEPDWRESFVADTLIMERYSKIVIRSESDFLQKGSVQIKGLVNNPGTFEVRPNMTLKDLIYMAEGLMMEADFDRIELSRVIEVDDGNGNIIPRPILLRTVSTLQDWQHDPGLDSIKVNAFDQVFIRPNPEFELQESVFVLGEVWVEGEFNKIRKAETLSSLVKRAGGVTDLAYLEGAYLVRQNIGNIALKLDKALRHPGSAADIPLLEGDTLVIPPRLDVVTIEGNVLKAGTTVMYEPRKQRFKYYVNLAGGFDRRTKKSLSTVAYVDGRVKSTRRFFIFRHYPTVEQGAVITVAAKPSREERGKNGILATLNIQEILSSATAILTFYVLLQRTL